MGELNHAFKPSLPAVAPLNEVGLLTRQLSRERNARMEAESIAEAGLRNLFVAQSRVSLLNSVAIIANQMACPEEAFAAAIEAICESVGWVFGHALHVVEDATNLSSSGIFHIVGDADLGPFVAATRTAVFGPGIGLPGRVLESRKPYWITDIASDTNFQRVAAAQECGLISAFAFPVAIDDRVVGVLEFFSQQRLEIEESLLDLVQQIGVQLGRVVERQRAARDLHHVAVHDALTGLPNRVLLLDRLAAAVRAFQAGDGTADAYGLLFIDLDDFKMVNDSLGHGEGDILLVAVATRLADAVAGITGTDGLPHALTLARMGGDEFALLWTGGGSEDMLNILGKTIHGVFAKPFLCGGQEWKISTSVGICPAHANHQAAVAVLRDADIALYQSKAAGRGKTRWFDEALRHAVNQRLQTEKDLRVAVEQREFRLFYQPIVSLADHRIQGFEALLRWDRDGRIITPGEFIEIAEDSGLILPIGNWVLREACRKAARMQAVDPDGDLTISVNVSPKQFLQSRFVPDTLAVFAETGARPSSVRLELTESIAIRDPGRTAEIFQELRRTGIKISLDDFGTGYSSLSYLNTLPFDTLKIDRSFVAALDGSSRSNAIVRAILDLAGGLSMHVVAEGLETIEQVDMLAGMGCESAQGYYFGRPMPEAAMDIIVRDGHVRRPGLLAAS